MVSIHPTSGRILSSLADLDFNRIGEDQIHSSMLSLASLDRGLSGAGYHRELVTSVRVQGGIIPANERVLLVENITQDIYIDLDQVSW